MIYSSRLLSEYPNIIFGISTRYYNNLSLRGDPGMKNTKRFLNDLSVPQKALVRMRQVHGNKIVHIVNHEKSPLEGVDGMVTRGENVFLAVQTADCLPIFLYDPIQRSVGVIHAGYRGILAHIIEEGIDTLLMMGSSASDLIVGIGPSIGKCCYNVKRERIEQFESSFLGFSMISEKRNGTYFLDLKNVAQQIFIQKGVDEKHIEIMPYCTSCHNNTFFSYRRDTKETFGEMLTVIGMK